MKKFIVLYHSPADAMKKMAESTPEEMKKGMEPWMEWAKKCGSALVDMGTPLGNAQAVKKDGVMMSNSNVNGYSVLQAEDMEHALALLKEHPHLMWADSCEIEVLECLPLPGM